MARWLWRGFLRDTVLAGTVLGGRKSLRAPHTLMDLDEAAF